MTDKKKPEAIDDEELESAQGGLFSADAGTMELMTDAGTMEVRGTRLKRPGKKMEVVNEDE